MDRTRTLIVGAGISGLACAGRLGDGDYMILEAEKEIGGYCRTVKRDGFTWDYSGHFFHFRNPQIESELRGKIQGRVHQVERDSRIWYADRFIDFPFQQNIHQLPEAEYRECVRELEQRGEQGQSHNFKDMLYARYGRAIAEKFMIPYNEKVYAANIASLDPDAMGRFFPHVAAKDILAPNKSRGNAGYNATFTYPEGGAIEYVNALATEVDRRRICLGERMTAVDPAGRTVTTNRRQIRFDRLISTVPFVALLQMCGIAYDDSVFDWNQVVVFNLGFNAKGPEAVHWVYYPQRELSFYRVGFYDNIFGADRMSLYVEIGLPRDASLDSQAVKGWLPRVLADLQTAGIVNDQALVASHHVVLDPAYVHVTRASRIATQRHKAELAAQGVHSTGRYGSWRYCSIEDNIVEARILVDGLDVPVT